MTVFLLRRYMLVDNEDDNKTHRPVAPKDVSLVVLHIHKVALIKSVHRTKTSTVIFTGSEEASSVPRQPSGNHKRRAIPTCQERRGRGHEEDVCQPQACTKVQIPLMTSTTL